MKLLLTSDGLSSKKIRKEFIKLSDKLLDDIKILLIYSLVEKKHIKYTRAIVKSFVGLKIKKLNIILANISKKLNYRKFYDVDIIYVCGGNTFYILDRLRKNKFDILIKNLVRKGKPYVGVSAGSIIAGSSIEIAGWGSERDENNIHLKNLKGFDLTNIAVFPHFKSRLKQEVISFRKKVKYPIQVLRDREALLIINKKVRKIK